MAIAVKTAKRTLETEGLFMKMRKIMEREKRFIILAAVIFGGMLCSFRANAEAYSQFWQQDSQGNWYVQKPDGSKVKDAWLCDDAVAGNGKDVWYLLDANGSMLTAGLVQDGTGNFYSLETEHNGYYGMLRYRSGNYGGVNLSLGESHNGSFAAVLNADGIEALKAQYGVTSCACINNSNIVYTSSFRKENGAVGGNALSGSNASTGSVELSASAETKSDYPGSFVITETVQTGWEEYRSPYGGTPSYMFKYHGTPIKGWVCVEGIWWFSPASQIDAPVDQTYAREKAGISSGSSSSQSDSSGEDLSWRPDPGEVDERTVAEYFIDYLNEYRVGLGKGTLRIDEERMDYAKERADRGITSHDENTMGYEICNTHAVLQNEVEIYDIEQALAKNAFDHFRASASHNSIMKLNTITTVGAGFMLSIDGNGNVYGYYCEANFGKD